LSQISYLTSQIYAVSFRQPTMNPLLPSRLLQQWLRAKHCFWLALLCLFQLVLTQKGNAQQVTISSQPTSGCVGQPITFTAVASNVGALPAYQWQVNGVNVGLNQNEFTNSALVNGDVVQCRVTAPDANGALSTTNSNALTMTILSPPTIVQHDTAICPGSTMVLQADISGMAYAKYKPVDFSNQFNFNLAKNPTAANIINCPTGDVTFNGVPFFLYPWTDNNTGWSAYFAPGNDPRKLVMPVNEDGVAGINLLACTYYGATGPASYASVSFWANGSIVYTKELIGNQDIRDYNNSTYTNNINNTTTVNAWQSKEGKTRLDNVHIQMPVTTRIDSILISDNGGNGQRIFIIAATVEKTPVALKWSTGETTPSITVAPSQPTTYTVMATNGVASCSGGSIKVSFTTPIVPSISISQSVNNVCPGVPVTFTATTVNAGKEPGFQWRINGVNAGTDSFMFTTGSMSNGDVVTCLLTPHAPCLSMPTATSNALTVTLLPQPIVDAGPNVTIHQGDAIQLRGTAAGDILGMQWSPATGLDNPHILNPIATPTVTTKYTLTVQNQNTCTATDSLTVKVLPLDVLIPNAISPNHDGVNDVWNILHLDQFTTCTVAIFNRNGQKLFTSMGYTRPWDGTYKNKRLPAGTYYYIIDLKDGSAVRSGYVVVVY